MGARTLSLRTGAGHKASSDLARVFVVVEFVEGWIFGKGKDSLEVGPSLLQGHPLYRQYHSGCVCSAFRLHQLRSCG